MHVLRRKVAEVRRLKLSSDILCLQETHGTTEEVQLALRPAVHEGALHVAPAEGAAGWLAVFVSAAVMAGVAYDRCVWPYHARGAGRHPRRIESSSYGTCTAARSPEPTRDVCDARCARM